MVVISGVGQTGSLRSCEVNQMEFFFFLDQITVFAIIGKHIKLISNMLHAVLSSHIGTNPL